MEDEDDELPMIGKIVTDAYAETSDDGEILEFCILMEDGSIMKLVAAGPRGARIDAYFDPHGEAPLLGDVT
jgi:hypothetical protein